MTINTALLIAAPMMQNYFVDKVTGLPLASGVVAMYKDSDRQVFKNWYYQVNQGGTYVFQTLPNPLTLSAVGTIIDVNGNNVIPFYYPFSEEDEQANTPETYFVRVFNDLDQLEFTLENFPPLPGTPTVSDIPTHKNYIVNNRFWQNLGIGVPIILDSETDMVVCPSQHDTFKYPDIRFRKNIAGATETLTFQKFNAGQTFLNAVAPEYYIEHQCTVATADEEYKMYQFPISLHIQTLESQVSTFSFFGANLSPTADAIVKLYIFQDLGTTANPDVAPIFQKTFNLTSEWIQHTSVFSMPSAVGLVPSKGGDDALYAQLWLPLDSQFDIGLALPSLYLGTELPSNDFVTYDEIDTVINSPRTGDTRTTFNAFSPFGWIPLNRSSIGIIGSQAQYTANVWPLYSLLWNSTTQGVCPVQPSRGASAYADFIDTTKYLTLPDALGRAQVITTGETPPTAVSNISGGTNLTVASLEGLIVLAPVQLTGITGLSGLSPNVIYYLITVNATTIQLAETLDDAASAIPINVGSAGSATMINALGMISGASETSEVPNHVHPFSSNDQFYSNVPGSNFNLTGGADQSARVVSGTTGNNTNGVDAIGLLQPSIFMNTYIKL